MSGPWEKFGTPPTALFNDPYKPRSEDRQDRAERNSERQTDISADNNAMAHRREDRDAMAANKGDLPSGYRWADAAHTRQEIIPGGAADTADALDPTTLTFYAQQYLAGAPLPQLGMGKQAASARQAILTEAARVAGASGLTGADQARQVAHYKAGSAQLQTLEKMAGTIGVNEQTAMANGQQFLDRSAELPGQTGISPLNTISDWIQRRFSGTTISAMDAAYNTFTNEYAKVVSGSPTGAGTLSDSARHEAMETIRSNQSLDQKQAAFDQMKADMANRMLAIHAGINDGYKRLTEQPGYEVPTGTEGLMAPAQGRDPNRPTVMLPGDPRRPGGAVPNPFDSNGGGPVPNPFDGNGGGAAANQPGLTAGGTGRTFYTQRDQALADEAQAAFVHGANREQMDAIAARYGQGRYGADLDKAIENRNRTRFVGYQFQPSATGHEETGITGAIANSLGSNYGSFAAGVGDAMTVGQLGHLARLTGGTDAGTDIALRLSRQNALPYMAGEVAGGFLPTAKIGTGLKAGAELVESPVLRALMQHPFAPGTAYGAGYGASTSNDPIEGAIVGGLIGAGTQYAGAATGSLAAKALARTSVAGGLNTGENALLRAADQTGLDRVLAGLRRASDLGVPASIADVSPEVNALTGSALRHSPAAAALARNTLTPRGHGQYDRLLQALQRDLGPVENIPQRSEELIRQANTQAGPLYDRAFAAPGAGAIYPHIEPLLNRPSMQNALARARTIAAEEGRDPTSLGFDLDAQGNTTLTQVPSWQTLDYAKRGMDDVLEGYRDSTTGRLNLDEHGRAIDQTRRQFLSLVDTANPDYAAARTAYAGPASERDALRMGQQAFATSPDQLAVNVGNSTPSQVDQMRLGFQSQAAQQAGKLRYSTNPFESVLGTPAMGQRLSTLYSGNDDGVARLLAQRDLESQLQASSNRLIGNSMKAERQVADAQFAPDPFLEAAGHAIAATATHGASIPITAARFAGSGIRGRFAARAADQAIQQADQLAPIALNTNPQAAADALTALSDKQSGYLVARALAEGAAKQNGAKVGLSVAQALRPYALTN